MDESLVYNILLYAVFICSLAVFFVLFFIKAPYGRHYRKGWGLETNARLGWMIMESPAVFVMAFIFVIGSRTANTAAIVFFLIWMTHYIHRAFIYPILMRGGMKNFPLLLIIFALVFNSINAYLNGRYLFYFSSPYSVSWLARPPFMIGLALFFTGLVVNIHSDSVLRKLRMMDGNGYSIPDRGFFRFVSNPNYLGEMLEWIGWAILTWSPAGLAFALFTVANLFPRALSNHRWYKKKFSDYPQDRKILIPFIY